MKTFEEVTIEKKPGTDEIDAGRELIARKEDSIEKKSNVYKEVSSGGELRYLLRVALAALWLTLIFFLVLPFMQSISKPPAIDLVLHTVDIAHIEPPPPPPQAEPEKEPEPEEKPPEMTEEAPLLDLSRLELALNPGFNESWMGGDFAVKLKTVVSDDKDINALFSMADLDQKPRVIYQPGPILNDKLRKKAPGTVYILFIVDKNGRAVNPIVQKSTNHIFEKSALAAVKKWRFEPGKRNGKAVRFRMRVPISFPKG
ncbi:MAG: energy transducer TonB [Candidatus Omnitrophota bacterium]|nr:energy transducer TonB [Candidatus Omnitrophota bacterium]